MSDATALDSSNGAGAARPVRPTIGAGERFYPGERERVERVLARLGRLGITHLRTSISWADWGAGNAAAWHAWLLERLGERVSVLVSVGGTPPPLGMVPRTSSPPRDAREHVSFVESLIERCGEHFSHLELWPGADLFEIWDRTLDPAWSRFCDMIAAAAQRAREMGKKVVLGGTSRPDPAWLAMLADRGVLGEVDIVGVQAAPALHAETWQGWARELARVREVVRPSGADVWITGAGHPTLGTDGRRQAEAFLDAAAAPVERMYWATVEDPHPSRPTLQGFHVDEREYHTGLCRADGTPKLLCRLLEDGGVERVRRVVAMHGRRTRGGASAMATLITGGAGFIGTNLADRLLSLGRRVIVYDTLARPGVERNAAYLLERHADLVDIRVEDVRDRGALAASLREAEDVFHFAAQVAVTTSLENPDHDRSMNIGGTANLLEELRGLGRPVPLVFTSTNKVYGHLRHIHLQRTGERYGPIDEQIRRHGVGEETPLDFCSPYGCSKGAADQYVLDYATSYRLPTVVLRMSCIYGPHQCGTEDQGWIAHFLLRAIEDGAITIYGDGRQVRDALFASDLVDAFLSARSNMQRLAGRAFNMGGGPACAVSLRELLAQIEALTGRPQRVEWGHWRVGDQRWYVSDTRRFQAATGWRPQVSVRDGVGRLYRWLAARSARPAVPAPPVGAIAG